MGERKYGGKAVKESKKKDDRVKTTSSIFVAGFWRNISRTREEYCSNVISLDKSSPLLPTCPQNGVTLFPYCSTPPGPWDEAATAAFLSSPDWGKYHLIVGKYYRRIWDISPLHHSFWTWGVMEQLLLPQTGEFVDSISPFFWEEWNGGKYSPAFPRWGCFTPPGPRRRQVSGKGSICIPQSGTSVWERHR